LREEGNKDQSINRLHLWGFEVTLLHAGTKYGA